MESVDSPVKRGDGILRGLLLYVGLTLMGFVFGFQGGIALSLHAKMLNSGVLKCKCFACRATAAIAKICDDAYGDRGEDGADDADKR